MKPIVWIFPLSLIVTSSLSLGCLWDTDTLADEITNAKGVEIYDLLTGQVPHHSIEYYAYRIVRLEKKLKNATATEVERNDLAVAYIRVADYDAGEKLLQENLATNPKSYETVSNLGVLEKKRGNYSKAAEWIEKALEIKPEGHMGLGDWYLKMLRYRAELKADPKKVPAANFLGVPYEQSFSPKLIGSRSELLHKKGGSYEKLNNLLRNDQSFADGYVAIGDVLAFAGYINLAYVAYVRASELGHPNSEEIAHRKTVLKEAWRTGDQSITVTRASKAIELGAEWLEKFQAAETKLAQTKRDSVKFAEVEAFLEESGVKRSRSTF